MLALGLVALPVPADAGIDSALWRGILERHTQSVDGVVGTVVDYRALKSSGDWRELIASLEASDPESLRSAAEKLAFWINAYNILAIDVVLRHYPVESIRDVGSLFRPVWNREAGRIGGRGYTLGEIEHEILRPLGDPRIHVAIVCASTSCPSLRRDAYTPERIDAQLDEQMERFVRDTRKGVRIERASRTIFLSRIFKWFEEDWDSQGGTLSAVARALPPRERSWLEDHLTDVRIRYLEYDWSLNEAL